MMNKCTHDEMRSSCRKVLLLFARVRTRLHAKVYCTKSTTIDSDSRHQKNLRLLNTLDSKNKFVKNNFC